MKLHLYRIRRSDILPWHVARARFFAAVSLDAALAAACAPPDTICEQVDDGQEMVHFFTLDFGLPPLPPDADIDHMEHGWDVCMTAAQWAALHGAGEVWA